MCKPNIEDSAFGCLKTVLSQSVICVVCCSSKIWSHVTLFQLPQIFFWDRLNIPRAPFFLCKIKLGIRFGANRPQKSWEGSPDLKGFDFIWFHWQQDFPKIVSLSVRTVSKHDVSFLRMDRCSNSFGCKRLETHLGVFQFFARCSTEFLVTSWNLSDMVGTKDVKWGSSY